MAGMTELSTPIDDRAADPARPVLCPECLGKIEPADRFCRHCGRALGKTSHTFTRPIYKWIIVFLAWCGWLTVVVTIPLIVWIDVESILATGPILMVFALLLIAFAYPVRSRLPAALGGGFLAVVLGTFLMIAIPELSPEEAEIPCLIVAVTTAVATLAPVIWMGFLRPAIRSPYDCWKCGYDLHACVTPACPECGEPIPWLAVGTGDD